MKLVEILAKELSGWPDSAAYAMQDFDKEIRFYASSQDSLDYLDFYVADRGEDACDEKEVAGGGIRVTRAQWQAERDRQKGGEWKRHRGGKQPVADNVFVEVKLRDGDTQQSQASAFLLMHDSCSTYANIMQYRVISQPQAEEVEYRGPFPCAPDGEPATTIEYDIEFPSGVFTLEAKTDQIDGPIKWRDIIIHCQAIIEDCEREIERNVQLLDSEGLMMQVDSKKAMQAYDSPVVAPEDWQIGDILEIVASLGENSHEFKIGEYVRVDGFDDDHLPVKCNKLDDSDYWYIKYDEAKFIRRP